MVATQGLFMLNDVSVMDAADAAARRVLKVSSEADVDSAAKMDARLNHLFELLLTTQPTDEERQELQAYITDIQKRAVPNAEIQTWTMVCQALFASSRFQVVE